MRRILIPFIEDVRLSFVFGAVPEVSVTSYFVRTRKNHVIVIVEEIDHHHVQIEL